MRGNTIKHFKICRKGNRNWPQNCDGETDRLTDWLAGWPTDWLTALSRKLTEKLTVPQLVNKFPHESPLPCSQHPQLASIYRQMPPVQLLLWDSSSLPHPIHSLVFPPSSSSTCPHQNTVYSVLLLSPPATHVPSMWPPNNNSWAVQITKLWITRFFPVPYYTCQTHISPSAPYPRTSSALICVWPCIINYVK